MSPPPPYRRSKTGPWRDSGDGVDRAPLVFRRRADKDDSSDTLVKVVAAILVIALGAGVAGLLKQDRAAEMAKATALTEERARLEARHAEANLAEASRLRALQAQRVAPSQRQLYRCIDSLGSTSVQDAPCAMTQTSSARHIVTIPDESRTRRDQEWARLQSEARLRQVQAELATALGQATAAPTYRTSAGSEDPGAMRCQSAKAQRDEAYRLAGNNRTFEMIRRWQDIVYEACKGT